LFSLFGGRWFGGAGESLLSGRNRGRGKKAKKNPAASGVFGSCYKQKLQGDNICRCRSLGAVNDVEADPLAFLQALETLRLDGGMVDKYVLAAVLLDKAESL